MLVRRCAQGHTKSSIQRALETCASRVSKLFSGTSDFRLDKLDTVADVLGTRLCLSFEPAGDFLTARPEPSLEGRLVAQHRWAELSRSYRVASTPIIEGAEVSALDMSRVWHNHQSTAAVYDSLNNNP